tara:strand:- start:494 stop:1432 length:939 start_codon:yes stop_codon:yes gene_type:complete
MQKLKKTICIISSFYNESENLKKFLLSFDKIKKILSHKGYNVILVMVNDGSTDNSINVVKKIKNKKKYIKLISLTKNYGQQIAIYTAIKKFNADLYGAIDSDCQQDPKYFIKMLKCLTKDNLDIVQMKKKYGNYEGSFKKLLSKFFYYIFSSFTNINLQPGSSDFYIFTKKVRSEIISSNISKFFLRGFIHWTGYPKKNLDYLPSKRIHGISKYNVYKQLDFALTAIYLYGTKLFVKLFIFSAGIMIMSLSFILYIIYDKFFLGSQVPGWASIATIVSFFGSFNLFFCCLVAFFTIKLGNILAIKPDYILEK